jgi:hypothetical protein
MEVNVKVATDKEVMLRIRELIIDNMTPYDFIEALDIGIEELVEAFGIEIVDNKDVFVELLVR